MATSAVAAQQLRAELLKRDVEGSILRQQLQAASQQLQQLSDQLSSSKESSGGELNQVCGLLPTHHRLRKQMCSVPMNEGIVLG